nr:chemotaxis protein CheR [Armatimonadota bacterium]
MDNDTPGGLIQDVSRLVESEMGLHYPPERWPDLQRGLLAAGSDLGYAEGDAAGIAERLLAAPLNKRQIEALAGALTVGETFFFRDRATFTALEHDILPALIAARRAGNRHLRLWSAGCCTGEEPYSLAMLIARLLPDREDWRVSILATDINPRFLQKAEEGVFAEWSFRDVPPWLKQRYFTQTPNGRFAILPYIKE